MLVEDKETRMKALQMLDDAISSKIEKELEKEASSITKEQN